MQQKRDAGEPLGGTGARALTGALGEGFRFDRVN